MKSKIVVKCSCGKKWEDDNTPAAAKSWWEVLDIADPRLSQHVEETGVEKTLELALRLCWSRHQAFREEAGDHKRHEATVTEEITLENEADLLAVKEEENDK